MQNNMETVVAFARYTQVVSFAAHLDNIDSSYSFRAVPHKTSHGQPVHRCCCRCWYSGTSCWDLVAPCWSRSWVMRRRKSIPRRRRQRLYFASIWKQPPEPRNLQITMFVFSIRLTDDRKQGRVPTSMMAMNRGSSTTNSFYNFLLNFIGMPDVTFLRYRGAKIYEKLTWGKRCPRFPPLQMFTWVPNAYVIRSDNLTSANVIRQKATFHSSSIIFTSSQHAPRRWSFGYILNPNLGGRGGRKGHRLYLSKERCDFLLQAVHCDQCTILLALIRKHKYMYSTTTVVGNN